MSNSEKNNQILIEEYRYEKVKKTDVAINIPQEPIYFQEHNHRVIIGLFPQFATWGDKSVWEIKIIQLSDKKITSTFIRTSEIELSDMVSQFDFKNKSEEDYLKDKAVRYLKDFFTQDRVYKSIFVNKYESILNDLNLMMGYKSNIE